METVKGPTCLVAYEHTSVPVKQKPWPPRGSPRVWRPPVVTRMIKSSFLSHLEWALSRRTDRLSTRRPDQEVSLWDSKELQKSPLMMTMTQFNPNRSFHQALGNLTETINERLFQQRPVVKWHTALCCCSNVSAVTLRGGCGSTMGSFVVVVV